MQFARLAIRLSTPALCAAALLAGAPAVHAADAFAELAAEGADSAKLIARLSEVAGRLARGANKVRFAGIVYCAKTTGPQREERIRELARARATGIEALLSAGFDTAGKPPDLTVIEVRTPRSPSVVLIGRHGRTILIRKGLEAREPTTRRRELPTLRERPDGPPIERDVIDAAGRLRVELWRRAAGIAAEEPTLGDALATHLLGWRGPESSAPPWLRAGTARWLSARIGGAEIAASGHRCGTGSGPDIAALIAAKDDVPVFAANVVGRLVSHLVAEGADLPDGARKLASGATFDAAFGTSLEQATTALAATGDGASGTCAEGRLACTLCEGSGKLEVSCTECAGTASVGCNSCFGTDDCISRYCQGGYHHYQSGEKVRCGYCGGRGTTKCKACAGKGARKCTACRAGKVQRSCPACDDGTLPCPEGGVSADVSRACGESDKGTCGWCQVKGLKAACSKCDGAGALGCKKCYGTTRDLCNDCNGSGDRRMVYTDGTVASATKCPGCNGKGYSRCGKCKLGKLPCAPCKSKGNVPFTAAQCAMCEGDGHVPDTATTRHHRRLRIAPPDEEQNAANSKMLDDATKFLLDCKTTQGVFALREFRKASGKNARGGKLEKPTLFANASVIWALSTVGIDSDDTRIENAWEYLRSETKSMLSRDEPMHVQWASLALRALISAGEGPESGLVKGLVERIVKGQQKNGLWADSLDEVAEGNPYQGLYAIETLWLAQRRGAKVPRATFQRAFRVTTGLFTARGYKGPDDFVTGTEIASATAMAIIAKAGALGEKASTFDYEALPAVERGLAWLDRYFDIRKEPIVNNGAFQKRSGNSGYAAYLFAIQRLAMLLNIEVLGGERWYATGARHLREMQFADGSFEETGRRRLNGPVRTTTSVLRFLARATPSVTQK